MVEETLKGKIIYKTNRVVIVENDACYNQHLCLHFLHYFVKNNQQKSNLHFTRNTTLKHATSNGVKSTVWCFGAWATPKHHSGGEPLAAVSDSTPNLPRRQQCL